MSEEKGYCVTQPQLWTSGTGLKNGLGQKWDMLMSRSCACRQWLHTLE